MTYLQSPQFSVILEHSWLENKLPPNFWKKKILLWYQKLPIPLLEVYFGKNNQQLGRKIYVKDAYSILKNSEK